MKAVWSTLLTAAALATTAFAGDSLPGTFDIFSYNPVGGTTAKLDLVSILTVPMTTYHVLSTAPETISWQGMTLSNGIIEAIPPEYYGAAGSLGAVYVNPNYPIPTPGPFPMWSNSFVKTGLWTAADNGDGTSTLSLTGFSNLFSLCESYFNQPAGTTNAVVFNASSSAYGDGAETYDGSSCVPITLLAIARA
ncbi:hypothetical protein PsYK624_055790 [Phanerochaete sordida]|uniref:Uncharacterized protein n=1 Tax=Phanerochaete sordida TaxID=48140 RepID=A0A9P3G5B7_9APHY|nr:hypothetical protein PsYK624_055790 [Phanerochaete sordida]